MVYTITQKQLLPISLEEAWQFFSNPSNLGKLTPPNIGFEIQHNHSHAMHEGQIITYKIQLAPFCKVNWVTEISHISDQVSFIDDQRIGPYKLWHHQHHFEEVDGGTLMTDLVHYSLPFGVIGRIAHSLFVKSKLQQIFSYRRTAIESLF